MSQKLQVSVIMPVYNAASFVTEAVESALALPETGEVILIEDGSPDGSLEVCQKLADKYSRVKLMRHAGGQNLGAGASRNLGIQRASCDYIAFLDADDLYLPERFRAIPAILEAEPSVDGVYGATGTLFEDEEAKERWQGPLIKTVKKAVPPENLFESWLRARNGTFHTSAIVVHRNLFERTGLFEPRLRMCQDSHLWIRMAAVGKLVAGEISQPISLRRVHSGNRVGGRKSRERQYYQLLMWQDLLRWGAKQGLSDARMLLLAKRYARQIRQTASKSPGLQRRILLVRGFADLLKQWPPIVYQHELWSMGANMLYAKLR